MQRVFSFLLCLMLLIPLVSCSSVQTVEEAPASGAKQTADAATSEATATEASSGTHESNGCFATGYARGKITPQSPMPLAGYGNTAYRLSKDVLDDLYITCVAISDGEGGKALICTLDLISMRDVQKKGRELISEKTGIPTENIFFCCTHTHSGVDSASNEEGISSWKAAFYKTAVQTAQDAIADLDSTEMYTGSVNVPGMTFVRRYLLADGTYTGDNAGNYSTAPIVSHETESDPQMQIIRFARKNQKDIIIANFQGHATMTGNKLKTDVSADFPGAFRTAVEKNTDAFFAFYQGAAGNLNPKSRISGEGFQGDYNQFGAALSDSLVSALPSLEKAETGKVCATSMVFSGKVNHEKDSLVAQAQEISNVFAGNDRDGANALCKKYGISSAFAANAILAKAKLGETIEFEIFAIRAGSVSFVGAPYEMFDTNGMEIKAATPFKMTFVCEQTNGANGYIPSAFAFPHGGYEPDTCKYTPGTAEELVTAFVSMLTTLYAA